MTRALLSASVPTARKVMGALALVLLGCAGTIRAQGAPSFEWEFLGLEGERLEGAFFAPGPAEDGSADTLYAHGNYGLKRRKPDGLWSGNLCDPCYAEFAIRTKEGYLLVGARAGATDVDRSTDGGQTWERDVFDGVTTLFQSTVPALGGAVYGCSYPCWRSFDGGAEGSWEPLGWPGGETASLGEVRGGALLPDGRLLAGLWNGLVYSDDAGQTWEPSSLWAPGALVVNSLAFDAVAGHPYGGAAYAGVLDLRGGERIAVHRSDDGGQTWTEVRVFGPGDFGVATPHWVVVGVDDRAGGALYVGIKQVVGGPNPGLGTVAASFDGGQTWVAVADTATGWGGYAVRALVVGRDGRLYAATEAGVYRTVEAVPVSSEPEPGEETGVRLEVAPNPFRDEAAVTLTLARPAHIRLTVHDALGRVVTVLAEGDYGAGRHAVSVGAGAALAPGAYFVRAAVSVAGRRPLVQTQALTLLR